MKLSALYDVVSMGLTLKIGKVKELWDFERGITADARKAGANSLERLIFKDYLAQQYFGCFESGSRKKPSNDKDHSSQKKAGLLPNNIHNIGKFDQVMTTMHQEVSKLESWCVLIQIIYP